MQTKIPCVLMRGGSSKGPFFLASDLPQDVDLRDRVLLKLMGSPDMRQIDGIGAAEPLTSKVVIVSPSERDDADVDYLFAQVVIDRAFVDTGPTCGNMLSGIGPFVIDQGLVRASDPETTVRIYLVNVDTLVEAIVQTPGGEVTYEGDARIDGVPGTAAPVKLAFVNAMGGKTGKLLPTGNVLDTIDGIAVSCVDAGMPCVIAHASDFAKTGYESKAELDADREFFARFEAIRVQAAAKMGMGDASGSVIPKFVIVAAPQAGGSFTARYFMPHLTHPGMAVTGAVCMASAAAIEGSTVNAVADLGPGNPRAIIVEHPTGRIEIELKTSGAPANPVIERAAVIRTTRRLFEGFVLIPSSLWPGEQAA